MAVSFNDVRLKYVSTNTSDWGKVCWFEVVDQPQIQGVLDINRRSREANDDAEAVKLNFPFFYNEDTLVFMKMDYSVLEPYKKTLIKHATFNSCLQFQPYDFTNKEGKRIRGYSLTVVNIEKVNEK